MYDKDKRHKVEKQSAERTKELNKALKALNASMPSHNWHDIMGSRYIHPVNGANNA